MVDAHFHHHRHVRNGFRYSAGSVTTLLLFTVLLGISNRSAASLASRMGYVWVLRIVGRRPLTLASMVGAGLGFACLAVPMPLPAMFAAMLLLGISLGIATTLSLTNVVDLASAAAMGTVMSLRITGNRIGQVALPFAASLIAAVTGVLPPSRIAVQPLGWPLTLSATRSGGRSPISKKTSTRAPPGNSCRKSNRKPTIMPAACTS